MVDLFTPDGAQGQVPPEAIIEVLRDSYWANDKHLVFPASGLVQLPPSLHDALVEAIKKLGIHT